MPYYLYIHNIYLYQYHDKKPNPINIDWLLGLTPTVSPVSWISEYGYRWLMDQSSAAEIDQ